MPYLLLAAFFAGFIDALVGGGGLISLPVLLLVRPDVALPTLLGTNKLMASCGTLMATTHYLRHVAVIWRVLLPAVGAGFVASLLGARVATLVEVSWFRPIILLLLVLVAIYTLWQPQLGQQNPTLALTNRQKWVRGLLIGGVIGFYDGILGPGTGSFLIFAFISLLGMTFLPASASAKMVNLTTNIAALITFLWQDHVLIELGLLLGLCNIAGAIIGARLAILRGNRFLRGVYLLVVGLIIARLLYDLLI